MDETRTINLILWIMLLTGMVFLGLFYFITSHQPQREPETASIEINQLVSANPSETISIRSSSMSAPVENPALLHDHSDTAATDTNEDIDPEFPPSLKDGATPTQRTCLSYRHHTHFRDLRSKYRRSNGVANSEGGAGATSAPGNASKINPGNIKEQWHFFFSSKNHVGARFRGKRL